MNRSITLVACTCVLLNSGQVFATSWDRVVFREDFDSSVGGMPDPGDWVVNDPESWARVQGRTYFPCPPEPPDPWPPTQFPRVEDGRCIIEHHLFNSFDPDPPYTEFLGGEIHTVLEFEPDRSYRFEARVRLGSDLPYPYVPYPDGLITSFFTYGYDGSNSDEIDFEFLSKLMNDDENYPNGDPFLTNPWNESHQCPTCIAPGPNDLILTEWNTFRIYWYPDLLRVDWTWVVDPDTDEEVLVRTEEMDPSCVPDEPMAVYFNFWVPPEPWPEPCDPYDALLQPVDNADDNEICAYEIDYVEVRTLGEADPPWYVDNVVIQTYDNNSCCDDTTSCQYATASRVLGPPDWSDYQGTVWWAGSPGEGGEFVVKFSRLLVVDKPGPDLRFWQGNGEGGETSEVLVSLDGEDPVLLCTLNDGVHSGGDPALYGYYFDCDLQGTGLNAIRYVKVVDVSDNVDGAGIDGSDIDAIEALNYNAIPTVSEWGLAVMTLLVLVAGTVLFRRRAEAQSA